MHFFDIHICNFVLIFSAIFNKGQVADINWVTDCSQKMQVLAESFFSKFFETLML